MAAELALVDPMDAILAKLTSEERADLAAATKPDNSLDELGRTGTVFFSGFLGDEGYTRNLRGEQAIRVYEHMWQSDGQIRAVLTVCELPLLEAEWIIQPASDDPLDVEIAQFIQDNLIGGGMNQPWNSFLKHALSMYRYGFAAFEQVYVLRDGRYMLRKLAPRLARTIYRVFPNDNDDIDHIQQRVYVLDEKTQTGSYQFVDIPGERLLVITLDREGNNFFGESLLRAAYQHWYIKSSLYQIDAIGCERQSLGVPYLIEPPDRTIGNAERRRTGAALASLHAHEKQFLLVPGGYQFGIAGVTGQTKPVLPSIEHHDLLIARSVLAQFLNLHEGGSYALAVDASSFFLQALRARGNIIKEAVNKQVIRKLVDLNWTVDRYPTLEFEDLDHRSVFDSIEALAKLYHAGGLTNNPETENTLRRMMNLPDLPPDAVVAPPTAPPAPGDGTTPPPDGAPTVETDSGGLDATTKADQRATGLLSHSGMDGFASSPYWRDLTPLEKYVDLAALENTIDQGKLDFMATVRPIVTKQIARLFEIGKRQLDRGSHINVATLDVPYAKELNAAILNTIEAHFKNGQEQVSKEFQRQKGVSLATPIFNQPEDDILKFFAARAESLTAVLNTKLKANFGLAINSLLGGVNQELDGPTLQRMSADLLRFSERDIRTASPTLIIDSLNIGRANEAQVLGAETAQFSAILDGNTCVAEGTRVHTSAGMRPIEEIAVGDPVLTHQGMTQVRAVVVSAVDENVVRVVTVGGNEIRLTDDHPVAVLVGDEVAWRLAGALQQGDLVIAHGGVEGLRAALGRAVDHATFESAGELVPAPHARQRRILSSVSSPRSLGPSPSFEACASPATKPAPAFDYLAIDTPGIHNRIVPWLPMACEVASVERLAYAGRVYDLRTDAHTFVAEGILVHNCDPCGAADGEEFEVGTDDYDSHMPPYQDCDGGDNCRCFPAGTEVSGQFIGGMKAYYEGPMMRISTESGRSLTVTPNHPILTDRGFVPAGNLREGDQLFSQAVGAERYASGRDGDDDPSTIDGVFDLLREKPFMGTQRQAHHGALHLHGDGAHVHGEVEVVSIKRELLSDDLSAISQRQRQRSLVGAGVASSQLDSEGRAGSRFETREATASRVPSAGKLPFDVDAIDPALVHRVGLAAQISTRLSKPAGESSAADAAFLSEVVERFTSRVPLDRVGEVRDSDALAPGVATLRSDPGHLQFDVKGADADARPGTDIGDRIPGLIAQDKVLDVNRFTFSGHVYDLSTTGGWYLANGIIASNCVYVYDFLA